MREPDPNKGADTPAGMLIRSVMAEIGAERVSDLIRALGEEWETSLSRSRKVYKWHSGDTTPNFASTIALLRLAGWIREDEGAAAAAAAAVRSRPPDDDRLESLRVKVDEMIAMQTMILSTLQGSAGGARAARPSTPRVAAKGRKAR